MRWVARMWRRREREKGMVKDKTRRERKRMNGAREFGGLVG